ncbi:MAG: hypothetical protein AB7F89_19390 [Pirellulaceae bacterium]
MQPGCYTELFFLDEATALAAGHRPCGECRRDAYLKFRQAWLRGNLGVLAQNASIADIDAQLHQDRVGLGGTNVRFPAVVGELPEGTFVVLPEQPDSAWLWWRGKLLPWSPHGYGQPLANDGNTAMQVLTPRSTVRALAAGYRAACHATAPA